MALPELSPRKCKILAVELTETTAEIPMVLLDRPFKKVFEGIAKWGLESVIQWVFIIAHYVRSRGGPRRRICGSGGTLNI